MLAITIGNNTESTGKLNFASRHPVIRRYCQCDPDVISSIGTFHKITMKVWIDCQLQNCFRNSSPSWNCWTLGKQKYRHIYTSQVNVYVHFIWACSIPLYLLFNLTHAIALFIFIVPDKNNISATSIHCVSVLVIVQVPFGKRMYSQWYILCIYILTEKLVWYRVFK